MSKPLWFYNYMAFYLRETNLNLAEALELFCKNQCLTSEEILRVNLCLSRAGTFYEISRLKGKGCKQELFYFQRSLRRYIETSPELDWCYAIFGL